MYLRDDELNAKDVFEKQDVFGNPIDREKSPFSQKQFGATLGGPLKKDQTFFFLSFERLDIAANNFVTISDADALILNRAGFPVTPGANPYTFEDTLFLGKINHQWTPNHSLVLRGNYADRTNENIEPFGGLTARSRGAVQLRTDYGVSLSETDILSPALGERGAPAVGARGAAHQLARPQLRRARATGSTRAGPRSRSPASPASDASASRPTRAPTTASSSPTPSPTSAAATWSRPASTSAGWTAATPRCRCTSAAATCSARCRRSRGSSRRRCRPSRRWRRASRPPTSRATARPAAPIATATSRCSCRTSGASAAVS